MKKLIILIGFLIFSTSFKTEPEMRWLGTMEIYVDSEGSVVIYYKGNIPQCMAKKLVDFVYTDCDTISYSLKDVEDKLHLKIDSCNSDIEKPMKTIRM